MYQLKRSEKVSKHKLAALAVLPMLLLAGCASTPSGPSSSGAPSESASAPEKCNGETVKVGVTSSLSDAAFFIARDKGYFADEGLKAEYTKFDSGSKMIAPLGAGQLNVGAGAPSAGFYNAMAGGVDLRMVATKGALKSGYTYVPFMVRKDLVDSGTVKDLGDLAGMRVVESGQFGTSATEVATMLEAAGLRYDDVKHVYLGFSDHITGYANKAIDAGVTAEPLATTLEQRGLAVRMGDPNASYPEHQQAVLIYGADFIKEQPAVAQCFMNAYIHAIRDFASVTQDGKWGGAELDDIVSIIAKETGLKADVITSTTPPYMDPDGGLFVDSLLQDYNFFKEQGVLEGKVSVPDIVDTSFAKKSVAKFGPFKPGAKSGDK